MDMNAFERIVISLPDFGGDSFSEFTNLSGISSSKFRATWQGSPLFLLNLMITDGQYVLADEEVRLVLPSVAGVALPINGLVCAVAGITVQAVSTTGLTLKVPLIDVPNVGALIGTPTLDYVPRTGGEFAALLLTFQVSMNLSVGDQVILWLPGFSANTGPIVGIETFVWDIKSNILQGSWSATQKALTLQAYSMIAGYQQITVRVSRNSGIRLPMYGISLSQQNLGISVSCSQGPILVSSLSTTAVGFFSYSEVSYNPGYSSVVTEIKLRFTPQMYIRVNETVTITLPGFFSDLGSHSFDSRDLLASNFDRGAWNQSYLGGALSLFAHSEMAPGVPVQAIVSSRVGIRVSVHGLVSNDPSILIETDAQDGPVQPTSVLVSPAVGALGQASLSFDPACSGQEAEIYFSFSLLMDIGPGAAVTLTLPHFEGPTAIFFTVRTYPVGAFSYAKWTLTSDGGVLQLARDVYDVIHRQTNVSVVIPAVVGLTLPLQGIGYDGGGIMLAVTNNDQYGSLQPTSVGLVQRVFEQTTFYNSSLKFDPAIAMTLTEITLRFRFTAIIYPGEFVVLGLPGFFGENRDFDTLFEQPAEVTSIPSSWRNSTSQIVMTFQNRISDHVSVTLRIPNSSGLVLPPQGLVKNQQDLTLKLISTACSSSTFPVESTPFASCE